MITPHLFDSLTMSFLLTLAGGLIVVLFKIHKTIKYNDRFDDKVEARLYMFDRLSEKLELTRLDMLVLQSESAYLEQAQVVKNIIVEIDRLSKEIDSYKITEIDSFKTFGLAGGKDFEDALIRFHRKYNDIAQQRDALVAKIEGDQVRA